MFTTVKKGFYSSALLTIGLFVASCGSDEKINNSTESNRVDVVDATRVSCAKLEEGTECRAAHDRYTEEEAIAAANSGDVLAANISYANSPPDLFSGNVQDAIDESLRKIQKNVARISTLQTDIGSNAFSTAKNTVAISNNTVNVLDNTASASHNASNIASNAGDVLALQTTTSVNASAVSVLQPKVFINTSNISGLYATVSANASALNLLHPDCGGDCGSNVYSACSCGSADPCNWRADGACDSTCATSFPDDFFTDTVDCSPIQAKAVADSCDSSLAGTIRWTGSDFHGCNGTTWVKFATSPVSE